MRSGEMQDLLKVRGDNWPSRLLARTGGLLCEWRDCNRDKTSVALDIHGGQNMYTPQNLRRPDAYPYDRPYAGWLYLGLRTHLADQPDGNGEALRLQSLDLIVGVVGPAAGAGKVQKVWHELIDATDPQGWGSQVKNEPTIQVSLSSMQRVPWGRHVDSLPYWRLAAGNVFTHAAVGAHLRVGHVAPDLRPHLALQEFSLDQLPARGTAPPSEVQRYGAVQIQYEQR